MKMTISAKVTGINMADMARRHPDQLAEALVEMAEHWHQHYLPRHFEPNAAQRYRYERRTIKYNRWKRRVRGEAIDLVNEKKMKNELLSSIQITPGKKGVTIKLHARALNFVGRAGYPDMKAEVTKITKKELAELGRFVKEKLADYINRQNVNINQSVA